MTKKLGPWERLQLHLDAALTENGFATAVGVHLGLAIALRHLEWAAAMNVAINESMEQGPESKSTDEVADMVVIGVPIEAVT